MRLIFVSDDTRIRTSEGQDYKRTVYLLDHNVTVAVVTNEGQDYKRIVYLLDHNVTAAVVSTSTIFLRTCINFFMRIYIFSYDPWIQPTKTRLISGQSIN